MHILSIHSDGEETKHFDKAEELSLIEQYCQIFDNIKEVHGDILDPFDAIGINPKIFNKQNIKCM